MRLLCAAGDLTRTSSKGSRASIAGRIAALGQRSAGGASRPSMGVSGASPNSPHGCV